MLNTRISLVEIARVMGGRLLENTKTTPSIGGVVIDSRQVKPGDLFFAFPGEKTDGHLYVSEAFRKGAAACVVSRPAQVPPPGAFIQVQSVEKALMQLAAWYRSKITAPVIAITGSSGKSTTKEIAAQLLARRFNVLAAPGSYNNEIGVPLTLLAWEPAHQALVLELAMRGKGQIRQLCEIARPALGLITSIGEAHVGLLGSLQAIADAKGELLEALPRDGFAFLNSQDEWTSYLARKAKCPVRTYGFGSGDWIQAQHVKETWEGTAFQLSTSTETIEFFFPLLGEHNLLNFLGAAAIALTLGVSLPEIKDGASICKGLHGRLERRRGSNGMALVDDTYNANPSSVLAALRTMSALPTRGRRVLVMGDMMELGEFGKQAHTKVGEEACALGIDALFGVGELTAFSVSEAEKRGLSVARHYPSHAALSDDLAKFLKPKDLVLVKGSRKMEMEKVVEKLAEELPEGTS